MLLALFRSCRSYVIHIAWSVAGAYGAVEVVERLPKPDLRIIGIVEVSVRIRRNDCVQIELESEPAERCDAKRRRHC